MDKAIKTDQLFFEEGQYSIWPMPFQFNFFTNIWGMNLDPVGKQYGYINGAGLVEIDLSYFISITRAYPLVLGRL